MQMGNYNIYYSQRPDGDIQIAKAKKIASKDAEKLARDGTLENKVKEMEKANEKMLQELLAMKKRGISYSDPAYQEKAKNLVANKMLLDTYKDTLHRTNAEKLKKGA
ncbi:MAG TPA: hypothetical protein VHD33_02800, partial [Legionellaceae bacterium]|nr:hypothetical protein [Legionellaceae bacterium]